MENLTKEQEYNLKLFPFYKMVSWDLLFYYSIQFLFLTSVKGLSASEVLFADAFYPIFKVLLQFLLIGIIDKIGFRKSILLANIINAFSILILIVGNGLSSVILSWFFMAFGYTIKDICESSMVQSFIPKCEKRNSIFSRVDGRGSSYYYYLDAVSSVATGFLFVINGYLPMILCFGFCVIGAILAYQFKPVSIQKNINKTSNSPFVFLKDLKHSFYYIFNSRRLRGLLLCSALFYTVFSLTSTLNSSMLVEINFPEQYYGILFAVLQIFSAVSAKYQNLYHKKLKNKTLSYFAIFLTVPLIFLGLLSNIRLSYNSVVVITFIVFAIRYIIKGPYYTLIYRYLNSFTTSKSGVRVYSANIILQSICRSLFSLLASWLLSFTSTPTAFIIIGCIFTIMFILLLDYMKTRVGLKPEEYKKQDIPFVEVK